MRSRVNCYSENPKLHRGDGIILTSVSFFLQMHIILVIFHPAAQLVKVYIFCIITGSAIAFLGGKLTSLEQSAVCMAELAKLRASGE